MKPTICIGCGCEDLHACIDAHGRPCAWLRVDRVASQGVCSECTAFVFTWDIQERPNSLQINPLLLR